jgi:cobaltochelatase CobS
MFVIQRVLECRPADAARPVRVIRPHPAFRLFATANTIGLGDTSGLYHGTQQINQGADGPLVDRRDAELPAARQGSRHRAGQGKPHYRTGPGRETVSRMVRLADMTRRLHERRSVDRDEPAHGDHLGRERRDLRRPRLRLPLTFLNKCDELERPLVAEFYQRCFGEELPESSVNVVMS